jgi:hypothetical protein
MAAIGTVLMTGLMPAAIMIGSAAVGILIAGFKLMLIDMIFMGMMQVPVVEIIRMIPVADCCVAAAWAVRVLMIVVFVACHRYSSDCLFRLESSPDLCFRANSLDAGWCCCPMPKRNRGDETLF